MDHDDILDSMSLSDDDMLDSLADDMLMEMEADNNNNSDDDDVMEEIHTVQPRARTAPSSQSMGFPTAGGGAGGMPDLGKMMSQMMPMMSQMFGGGAGGNNPFGMPGNNSAINQQKLSWEEVVRQHIPAGESASEWIAIMKKDEQRLRHATATKQLSKPHSRSYRQNASPLPNVYMEVETLLASMLNEAVRASHCEHNAKWRQYHDNLVSQMTRAELTKVFERDFKQQLRERVMNDPDYLAEKAKGDDNRFRNITEALAV
uniref:Uncharacterized protein n=1 Tax=Globisporangium ultimum (strain ATCC 200006 / CBS 805.95 / DAOM BR144) TaxID=431595 RepID=K3WSJ9_GLOUD